jgi:hypothetical protein
MEQESQEQCGHQPEHNPCQEEANGEPEALDD